MGGRSGYVRFDGGAVGSAVGTCAGGHVLEELDVAVPGCFNGVHCFCTLGGQALSLRLAFLGAEVLLFAILTHHALHHVKSLQEPLLL